MIYVSEKDPDLDDYESPFEPRDVKVKQSCNPKTEYNLGIELGRGKFGVVYHCTEKKTGKKLAAKFITTINKQDRENVEREVSIMCELQHPKILQLYDAYDDGKEMCMIMELVEGGELFERVLNEDFELSERACSIFMRQIAMACEYIHSRNVVHLDLKPENVLVVDKSGNRIKIIDFGLARRIEKGKKLQVLFGTFEFVAPEVLAYDNVGYYSDMWSVGVICYVLLSGLSPFAGDNDLQTMGNVSKVDYDFDDESFDVISNEAKDFIEKLLVKNPSKRLTASQALQHPWINPRKRKSMYVLDKTKLRKFVIRRRWHKAVLAIRALRRMGANLLNF